MARGDVITVAVGGDYGGKPRPAVIVQADQFLHSGSVTFCLITSTFADVPLRRRIEPNSANGLRQTSWVMVDKIMTMRSSKIGKLIGRLNSGDMAQIDGAITLFLGLSR